MTNVNIPELPPRCNSWIIAHDDKPVIETWDRVYVQTIANRKIPSVVIYTALQWLQRFNASITAK